MVMLQVVWHPAAQGFLNSYSMTGIAKARRAGKILTIVPELAKGKWRDLDKVPRQMTPGKEFRYFCVGELTVVVQVLLLVELRVVAVDVVHSQQDFNVLVSVALSRV